MEVNCEDNVTKRLRRPPSADTATIKGLIQKYLPEIQEARRLGKTWAMIGMDLRPEEPVAADTARKTVSRLGAKGKTARRRNSSKVKKKASTAQTPLEMQSRPKNPFARQVDPIREEWGQ